MKSRTLTFVTAMTLFISLAMHLRLAAQDDRDHHHKHHHYQVIDIGTFGGSASYINAAYSLGAPNQINRRGAAVGSSATSEPAPPDNNPGNCAGIDGKVSFVFHAFKWQNGTVTDLGALPGDDNCSVATSINANGDIVGRSEIGVIDPPFDMKEFRAVLWKDGEIRDLGTFGGKYSLPGSINNQGQVVGGATNAISDPFSLLYQLSGSSQGTQTRAFLWENDHKRDLGTLGGPDAWAFLVNEKSQVVGLSYVNSTPNSVTGFPTLHPFLWHKDRMTDLGTLGGFGALFSTVSVNGLNNRGQVIGLSPLAGDQVAHPFLWDDGKLIDLTAQSGGLIATANAINDAGEVVGAAVFPNEPLRHAYLWRNGAATDLGTVGDDCTSEAFAINSTGQVVGQSLSCVSGIVRSFLWENGSMVDLNALIPPDSDLLLDNTLVINDHGEIGGLGVPPGCAHENDGKCGHAYVLIPCDENHAGIEGCDYGMVEVSDSASAQPRASGRVPPAALLQRSNRLHFPRPVIGPSK